MPLEGEVKDSIMFLKGIVGLVAVITIYRLVRLVANYISARRLGLPIIIVPATWQDTVWVLIAPLFRFLSDVPFFSWYKYSYLGYNMHVRYDAHARLGSQAFVIVSPGRTEIVVADGPAVAELGGKYKKWDKPLDLYSLFAVFGPNVLSMNGEDWLRHRRIVNHGLARNDLVRVSAAKQADQWLKTVVDGQKKTLKELAGDMDMISSNVLNYAGFGQDNPFGSDNKLKQIPEGHTKSFAEAMHFMSVEFLFAWIFTNIKLPKWCQWDKYRELNVANAELRQYFSEIVQRRDGEVVRALVEANEKEKVEGGSNLNTDELFGNMYLVQLAGYETTSFAMTFGLSVLAAYPEVQEWARGSDERCNAVMHEILRFYGAVPVLTRYSTKTETITIAGKDMIVPANTYVTGSPQAYHHDPAVWGPDVGVWKPARWIEVIEGQERVKKQPELLAWSAGVRVCPGMKFSQIEFAAVVRTVLERYDLRGSVDILETVGEFDFMVAPKMRNPGKASVTFVKRAG